MSTTDDKHDELPAPHFEDRLWRALADAHGQQTGSTAGGDRQRGRSRARHGRRLLTAGIGTIAAAAAMITTVSIVGSDGAGVSASDRRSASESAQPARPTVDLAAQITAATKEAVADSVVHTIQDDTNGPSDTESWYDETSGVSRWLSYDEAGAPSYDSGAVEAPAIDAVGPPPLPESNEDCPSWQEVGELADNGDEIAEPADCPPTIPPDWPTAPHRMVDYCFDEYQETEMPALPAASEAQLVGDQLAAGELVEDGTEIIDGRELIRLRNPGEWVEHVYYVDPETYRPVQLHGYPDSVDAAYVMTFEYLPRTRENLARLVAPIPDGFVQVDQHRGDRARYEAGCGF